MCLKTNIKIFNLLILFIIYKYNIFLKTFYIVIIYILKNFFKNILINIDLSGIKNIHGPGNFIKGINETLPFFSNKCIFISNKIINSLNPDYFYLPWPMFDEKGYENLVKNKLINKYILGPTYVPSYWNHFPYLLLWKEKRFLEILSSVKGVVIHSNRVRNHLVKRSNTTDKLKKYIIMRACTNLKPKLINAFNQRKIDIIFFEKYMDSNHFKQGNELMSYLNKTNKTIVNIKYGNYDHKTIKSLANNSKFIIYFSFFDTGAIGLKEIQNFGVFAFTHQEDLVIDKDTCFYIPELASINNINIAYEKIINIIENVSKKNPNSKLIAEKNQMINKCENSLNDLCKSILE